LNTALHSQASVSQQTSQTIDRYIDGFLKPAMAITTVPSVSNATTASSSSCPAGWNCLYDKSEINFFNGGGTNYGLGAYTESWVEGPDQPSMISEVYEVKEWYSSQPSPPPPGDPSWVYVPISSLDKEGNGKGAEEPHTEINPKRGSYMIESFHEFFVTIPGKGTLQVFPQCSRADCLNSPIYYGQTPAPPDIFNNTTGYDYYQTRVDLQLQVGSQTYSDTNTATVTDCSSAIPIQAILTPALPDGNVAPPISWTGGKYVAPGKQGNINRTVDCQLGQTTVTARIGQYLNVSVTVKIQPATVSLGPSDISGNPGDVFAFTATSSGGNGSYNWSLGTTQQGDNAAAFQFVSSACIAGESCPQITPDPCVGAPTCTVYVQATSAGLANVFVAFQTSVATSQTQSARVGAITVQISRQSLTQFTATGSPPSGTFSYSETSIQGLAATLPLISPGTSPGANPNSATLSNPDNSCPNKVPCAGSLGMVFANYQLSTSDFTFPLSASTGIAVPTFGMSCYITADQSEWGTAPDSCRDSPPYQGIVYTGYISNPPGASRPAGSQAQPLPPGNYCRSFLKNLCVEGSGRLTDGTLVKCLCSDLGNCPYKPTDQRNLTSDNTPIVAGFTVARDRYVIPATGVTVDVTGFKNGLKADDTGGAILGYRLDYYGGLGTNACNGYLGNPMGVSACNPATNGCPSGTAGSPGQ